MINKIDIKRAYRVWKTMKFSMEDELEQNNFSEIQKFNYSWIARLGYTLMNNTNFTGYISKNYLNSKTKNKKTNDHALKPEFCFKAMLHPQNFNTYFGGDYSIDNKCFKKFYDTLPILNQTIKVTKEENKKLSEQSKSYYRGGKYTPIRVSYIDANITLFKEGIGYCNKKDTLPITIPKYVEDYEKIIMEREEVK
jgi:hypothetical protein